MGHPYQLGLLTGCAMLKQNHNSLLMIYDYRELAS